MSEACPGRSAKRVAAQNERIVAHGRSVPRRPASSRKILPLVRYWHETLEKLNAAEGAKVQVTQSGYPMLNPLIALWKQACEMMDKFDTEFGCTAASRTRIRVEPAKKVDPFEQYRARVDRP